MTEAKTKAKQPLAAEEAATPSVAIINADELLNKFIVYDVVITVLFVCVVLHLLWHIGVMLTWYVIAAVCITGALALAARFGLLKYSFIDKIKHRMNTRHQIA